MAALDDGVLHFRWLLHSMHYQLAVRGGETDNPDQRISEDIGGFISGEGGRGTYMNVGIYNYTIQAMATATNLVAFSIILLGALRSHGPDDLRRYGSWLLVLGRRPLRLLRHRHDAPHRTIAVAARVRQQAVKADFRFDLARIREFSEQIALLKGEDREIDRAGRVSTATSSTRSSASSTFAPGSSRSSSSLVRSRPIIPYVVVAPFYYVAKKVEFGSVQPSGGRVRQRQQRR